MSEAPLANAPEARTETGEIKDVSTQTSTSQATTDQTTQTTSNDGDGKAKEASTTKADGTTLLTQKEGEAKPEGAPEAYTEFKLPEGIKLEGPQLEEATKLFKELGLPQAAAQSLVDYHAAQMKAITDATTSTMTQMRSDWQAAVKADPEIGSKLPQVKVEVSRALDSLGDPALVTAFKSAMDLTGVGDNPAFIKAFYKMAQAVNEGKHVAGANPSPHGQTQTGRKDAPSAAAALYPNLPSARG